MLIHEFDEMMEAVPFLPFRVYTADGRGILVKGPRLAWHAPADRTVWISDGKVNGRKHIIDLQLVTRFTIDKRRGTSGGNGNGRKRRPK